MKKTLFFLMLVTFFSAYGQEVTRDEAIIVAKNYFSSLDRNSKQVITFNSLNENRVNDITTWYVVNFLPEGWVIVSGRKETRPILAFSYTGSLSLDKATPPFLMWTQYYSSEISLAISDKKLAQHGDWSALLNGYSLKKGNVRSLLPILTSTWNQDWPYNDSCPADAAGPHGRTYAGCVATAMGQLLYYFRYPEHGMGSYSYECPGYGTLSADFSLASYDWSAMSDAIDRSNPEIAKLLYHLGISVDMQYGPDGSGMYNHKAAYSLRTYFGLNPGTCYLYRDSTNLNWDSVIIDHLDRRIPLYYAGWSVPNINGHAFVCDGYQDSTLFHFNFGWGGNTDGYYSIDPLMPGGSNFNLAQELIINATPYQPGNPYPSIGCQSGSTLRSFDGSLTDGGNPLIGYSAADCNWLIEPQSMIDSVSALTLSFNLLDLDTGDSIYIYAGTNSQSPLLGSWGGSILPDDINYDGNTLFVSFKANSNSASNGFDISYHATLPVYCKIMPTIYDFNGSIEDGSGRFQYNDDQTCLWRIQPDGAQSITLVFDEFALATDDYLKITNLVSNEVVAQIYGQDDPSFIPEDLFIPASKVSVLFKTNDSNRGQGWKMHYDSNVGVDQLSSESRLSIIPNPNNGSFSIRFPESIQISDLTIYNETGIAVYSQKDVSLTPSLDLRLSLQPGLYFVTAISRNGISYIGKFIVN